MKYTHIQRLNGFKWILNNNKVNSKTLRVFEILLKEHSINETISKEYLRDLISLDLSNRRKSIIVNRFLTKQIKSNSDDFFKEYFNNMEFKKVLTNEDITFLKFRYKGLKLKKRKTMTIKRFNYKINKQKVILKQYSINASPKKDYKTFRFIELA